MNKTYQFGIHILEVTDRDGDIMGFRDIETLCEKDGAFPVVITRTVLRDPAAGKVIWGWRAKCIKPIPTDWPADVISHAVYELTHGGAFVVGGFPMQKEG